jgi:hypothetical protein
LLCFSPFSEACPAQSAGAKIRQNSNPDSVEIPQGLEKKIDNQRLVPFGQIPADLGRAAQRQAALALVLFG